MASVRRAAAPASDTSDFQGANLLKDLSQSCDEAWLFLALFVIVMSIQYIAGIYVLGTACLITLDRRFRGFIAAEDGKGSRVCIALFCARMAFDMSASNGDATPLHTLFKPIPDPPNLADMVWRIMVKGLVLRLVTLSVEAFAGLLLQWQPMGYTVTERVVRMFVHLKAIFSPS
ncbi:hypothetical protein AaE_001412, partial [Aphanomyces astaci]